MVYYGNEYDSENPELPMSNGYWGKTDMEYLQESADNTVYRFSTATNQRVELHLEEPIVQIPLPEHPLKILMNAFDVPEFYAEMIWYYYHPIRWLIENVALLQKTGFYESGRCNGDDCDALLILTSASMGAMGASFRPFLPVVVVNTPSPYYWAVNPLWDIPTPGFVGNVLVHELGHSMGLDHACTDFFPDACDSCAYPNDAMSYCRSRWAVNLFKFCSLDFIENHYIPSHPDGTMYRRKQAAPCNDPVE